MQLSWGPTGNAMWSVMGPEELLEICSRRTRIPWTGPTKIYINNQSALKIINDNQSPTVRTRHMDIRYFCIQDWKENGDILMHHIPGIINPSDDLTKPLGWVLHSRHCRRIMGHHESIPVSSSKVKDPLAKDPGRVLEIGNRWLRKSVTLIIGDFIYTFRIYIRITRGLKLQL